MEAETWRIEEDHLPAMIALLKRGGVDLEASSIDRALAHVHPIILTPEALATLSEEEQAVYWHEVRVLKSPGWSHPAYREVELPG